MPWYGVLAISVGFLTVAVVTYVVTRKLHKNRVKTGLTREQGDAQKKQVEAKGDAKKEGYLEASKTFGKAVTEWLDKNKAKKP
jgi:hypothetical protein